MLFRLSHKSWSVVNGVRIRLSQSIPSPSLTSHLLPYTLHARFGSVTDDQAGEHAALVFMFSKTATVTKFRFLRTADFFETSTPQFV